jgi:hypothetical protein
MGCRVAEGVQDVEDTEGLRARVHGFVRLPRLADCARRHAGHAGPRRSGGVLVFRIRHRGVRAVMSFPAWKARAEASAGGLWQHHAEGVRE